MTHAPASQDPRPHEMQPIALTPQAESSVPPRQRDPSQQPAQLVALHAEVVQVSLVHALPRQSRQARPPSPHDCEVSPGRHRPPMQQPDGQEAAVHWQRPRRHSTPGSHAGPVPHRHSPVRGSHLSAPMAAVQGGPTPQAQRPPKPQVLVVRASHVTQAAPALPQANALGVVTQVPFEQQPRQSSQPDIGAERETVTGRSAPSTTATRARPWPTTAPARRPSTKISSV